MNKNIESFENWKKLNKSDDNKVEEVELENSNNTEDKSSETDSDSVESEK